MANGDFLDTFKKNFSQLTDPTVGFGKEAISRLGGLSSLGERTVKGIGRFLTPKQLEERLGFKAPEVTAGERFAEAEILQPTTPGQEAGAAIERFAEFFIPVSRVAKAEKFASDALKLTKAPKSIKKLGDLAVKSTGGGLSFGGVAAAQQGKVDKNVKEEALIGAAFPPALAAAGAGLKPVVKGGKRVTKKFIESVPGLEDKILRGRTIFQDKFLPARVAQKTGAEGRVVPEAADFALEEELFHGTVAPAVKEFQETQLRPVLKTVVDASKRSADFVDEAIVGIQNKPLKLPADTAKIKELEGLSQQLKENPRAFVQDYLVAAHAPERNAILGEGAAGITTAQAKARLAELKKLPFFNEVETAAKEVQALAKQNLSILREGGLIDDVTFNRLNKIYPNYVPLQRVFADDETFDTALGLSRTFGAKQKQLTRAKGSERAVDDILTSITQNTEEAIGRSRKNRVGQATINYIREFPDNGFMEIAQVGGTKPKGKDVIRLKEAGEDVFVRFSDPRVQRAFENVGTEGAGLLTKTFGPMTRLFSALNTTFNPEFLATNFTKDVQAAGLNLVNELGPRGAARASKNVFRGQKGVYDALKGKDTPGARLYNELVQEGGTTQFFQFKDRAKIGKSIEQMQKELSRAALGGKVKNKKSVLEGLQDMNEIVENGIRLSAYEQALASGMSKKKAAQLAKNATVNFNKKGEIGGVLNSLFAFSNASIQGSFRTFKALSNPKTAAPLVATIAAPATTLNFWNDFVDPEGYAKVPDFEKETNYIFMTGDGEGSYVKIPVPWGWNVFKVAADEAYNQANGKQSMGDTLTNSLFAFSNAYNPLGSNSVSTFFPTATRPAIEAFLSNKTWYGGDIQPKNFQDIKASLNFFESTNPIFVDIAKLLSEGTGGRAAEPGAIEVSPEQLEYLYQQYTGGAGRFLQRSSQLAQAGVDILRNPDLSQAEPIPINEVPFARRFLGKVNDDRFNTGIIFDTLKTAKQKILTPEENNAFVDAVEAQLAAGEITDEQATKNLKTVQNEQNKLAIVEQVNTEFAIEEMDDETYARFREALANKKAAQGLGLPKNLNKTQLKILDTFR